MSAEVTWGVGDGEPRAVLEALLLALAHDEPAVAAAQAWPLLGRRPAGEVGDEAGLERLLGNDRHRALLGRSRREVVDWDVRDRAARAFLRVSPADGSPPHGWLIALARTADGVWRVSGLQREGHEV